MLSVSQIVKITEEVGILFYKVLKENLGYVSNRLVRANQSFSGDVYEAGDGRVITLSEQWRKKYEYHKFKAHVPRNQALNLRSWK
jgi:hypothetical protein